MIIVVNPSHVLIYQSVIDVVKTMWMLCGLYPLVIVSYKKNFERREKNSHAGNRTRAMAVKTPDPNHYTTWDEYCVKTVQHICSCINIPSQ